MRPLVRSALFRSRPAWPALPVVQGVSRTRYQSTASGEWHEDLFFDIVGVRSRHLCDGIVMAIQLAKYFRPVTTPYFEDLPLHI